MEIKEIDVELNRLLELELAVKEQEAALRETQLELTRLDRAIAEVLQEGNYEIPFVRSKGYLVHRSHHSIYGEYRPDRYVTFLEVKTLKSPIAG